MAYTKTDWAAAKIGNANLNKMQGQYDEAVVEMWNARANTAQEIRAAVVSAFPAHRAGLLIFHSVAKRFFMSDGEQWLVTPGDALFGNGAGGDFVSDKNITLPNDIGATVIADYASFYLGGSHALTTQNPCRCLVIRSWGDIVIDGEINLDRKGGFGDRYITIGGVQYDLRGGAGGNGGAGGDGHASNGFGGAGGKTDANENCAGGRRGGGGGGGGSFRQAENYYYIGMDGGRGGSKNTRIDPALDPQWGGAGASPPMGGTIDGGNGDRGAGGGGSGISALAINYCAHGGRGGGSQGGGSGGGGGASLVFGSRDGAGGDGYPSPGEYGGGALVLLAGGDIVVNGQILARGGAGGNGGAGDIAGTSSYVGGAGGGGGGGGSGGGRVVILHRGGYTLTGDIVLTGGVGGTGGASAGTSPGSYSGSSGAGGSVQAAEI